MNNYNINITKELRGFLGLLYIYLTGNISLEMKMGIFIFTKTVQLKEKEVGFFLIKILIDLK